ncbi:hypothetical protein SAMN05428996_2039 [Quadrisphaera sp. DSM 44207]|nr:hypothetical protein SAMN05428996_2039 [Quadrisphaera sp. DSM 44207]
MLGSSPRTRGALERRVGSHVLIRLIPAYAGSTRCCRRRRCRGWAHPRVRGEHLVPKASASLLKGSSPRTRGARGALHRGGGVVGLIPAYAGSTAPTATPASTATAHPRVRGEHPLLPGPGLADPGSSPRTRGAQRRLRRCDRGMGLIPAYAGSTSRRSSYSARDRGSSPRTRGARGGQVRVDEDGGLIPAYAGSTSCSARAARAWAAHPRVRGEHKGSEYATIPVQGSSPRTRGALDPRRRGREDHGLIPAYAGSTVPRPGPRCGAGAHPRVRGEHLAYLTWVGELEGSSPRTRGARAALQRGDVGAGLIPAYAGSTQGQGREQDAVQAHPRVRGEHIDREKVYEPFQGSSPRTRGARRMGGGQERGDGLILAYAGSTPHGRWTRARGRAHPRVRGEHRLSA